MNNLLEPLRVLRPIYNALYWPLVYPLKLLYFFGPNLYGIGFWQGQDVREICMQLTNNQPPLQPIYAANMELCEQIAESAFTNFLISLTIMVYFSILVCVTKHCYHERVRKDISG